MKRNKFIIVGIGSIGLELLRKISKGFELTCIDINHEVAEIAKKIRADCTVITGDATSRLVLEQAGAADADGIIITTTMEKVNVEVARVLREHFGTTRIISIATTKAEIEALESYNVEAENIFTASAVTIRNKLEHTSRAAHAIGLGKNEILEVEVHPHSRLANRALSSLTPIKWRIGIIYRDENIIIPGRDTVLKPKDKVVILGDPGVLKTISEILTFKFQQFPLEYGSTVIAYLTGKEEEDFFNELDYLFSVFPLGRLIPIFSKTAVKKKDIFEQYLKKENLKNLTVRESDDPPFQSILQTASEVKNELGIIAVSMNALIDPVFPFVFQMQKKNFLDKLLEVSSCPVLLSNGSSPYKKTLVPCVEGINLRHSLETAVEISLTLHNEVTASLVRPSKYISTDEDLEDFDGMKKTVNDIGLMYKLSVKTDIQDGNPVKLISASLKNYDLLVADIGSRQNRKWVPAIFEPDVPWHIIRDSDISVLLLPSVKEAL